MTGIEPDHVNIGLQERNVRRVLGYLLLAGSLLAAVWMILSDSRPVWILLLFVFFYQGIRFILDYQTGTCPVKSEVGQKKMDARFLSILGEEITDQDAVIKIRNKSRRALF